MSFMMIKRKITASSMTRERKKKWECVFHDNRVRVWDGNLLLSLMLGIMKGGDGARSELFAG